MVALGGRPASDLLFEHYAEEDSECEREMAELDKPRPKVTRLTKCEDTTLMNDLWNIIDERCDDRVQGIEAPAYIRRTVAHQATQESTELLGKKYAHLMNTMEGFYCAALGIRPTVRRRYCGRGRARHLQVQHCTTR